MASVYVDIRSGSLELNIDYDIECEKIKIKHLGIASTFYWNLSDESDERITADQIRELMNTIERSLFNDYFTMQILIQIPPLLAQYERNDLAAVAMDWLSQYHMNPPKNKMRL